MKSLDELIQEDRGQNKFSNRNQRNSNFKDRDNQQKHPREQNKTKTILKNKEFQSDRRDYQKGKFHRNSDKQDSFQFMINSDWKSSQREGFSGSRGSNRNQNQYQDNQSQKSKSTPWDTKKEQNEQQISGLASGGTKLLIKNLHFEITEDKLQEILTPYGQVHSCKLVWDKHDRSTGEAIAIFEKPKSADEALKELNGSIVEGQKIQITKTY
eukprot:403371927